MTKNLYLTALSFVVVQAAMAQDPLPNNGFETWETLTSGVSTYEEPLTWNATNTCTALLSITPITKSTDAHSGSFSAKLETLQIGAIKANGVLSTATMVCAPPYGISGGIAYNLRPDSIVGWYKCTPQPNDTSYVQFILFDAAGDSISYTRKKFPTATSTWTRFSAPLTYLNNNPIVLSSFLANSSWGDGNQGEAVAGSLLWIDDVELVFATGINDHELASRVNVFPNPANGELSVSNASGAELRLELMDLAGKMVKRSNIGLTNAHVNVAQLAPGTYIYRLSELNGTAVRVGKLIINL